MKNLSNEFGPFNNRIWLNTAHQGPLPRNAVEAIQKAVKYRITPHLITDDLFEKVPLLLKEQLGKLIGVSWKEIILGNSTTFGLHILANGIPLKEGDEILLVKGDFPASIVSWLYLKQKGITIRFIQPAGNIIQPDELRKEISPNTKVFCTSWVNSFNGYAIDLYSLGEICRSNNSYFIVNGSQAIGAKTIDISNLPVDALTSCGFKWLCGPYGTGFCWINPKLLEILNYNQEYWLTQQAGHSLNNMKEQDFILRDDLGAAKYDVFCTANFFNFMPWIESIRLLLTMGIDKVETYDIYLVSYIINNLDYNNYTLISSKDNKTLSSLVVITHKNQDINYRLYESLKKEGIDIALREGNLRISPHIFNTIDELEKLLSILKRT